MIYVNAVDSLVMISRYKTSRTNVPKRTLTVSVVEAMKLTNVKFTEKRYEQFCVYICMNVWLLESITIYTLYYHWSLITCFVLTKGLPEILTRNCNKDFKFVNRQICSYNYTILIIAILTRYYTVYRGIFLLWNNSLKSSISNGLVCLADYSEFCCSWQ